MYRRCTFAFLFRTYSSVDSSFCAVLAALGPKNFLFCTNSKSENRQYKFFRFQRTSSARVCCTFGFSGVQSENSKITEKIKSPRVSPCAVVLSNALEFFAPTLSKSPQSHSRTNWVLGRGASPAGSLHGRMGTTCASPTIGLSAGFFFVAESHM
jgi:hypothetical protein